MYITVIRALLFLLLAATAISIDYRLPITVIPLHYTIKLVPYFEERNFTFDGEVEIIVNATKNSDSITLHYDNIEIQETPTVTSLDNKDLEVLGTNYDNMTYFYTLQLNGNLTEGCQYRIRIKYIGYISDKVIGFYRCHYNVNNQRRWYAVSYFEPAFARMAFPCFDEPALKARFSIMIARLPDYQAISNMPRINVSEPDLDIGGRIWDTFQESPPMSTYLVAFLVSDFKNLSSADGRYSIWGQENILHRSSYALSLTSTVVEFMENYTGVPYSLPKLDSIVETCFRGGMENWGLVVYQAWQILESNYTTVFKEINIQDIVVHEVSHMWFGNLITPDWWGSLWLKEGFARYFEYVITQQLRPEWRKEEQFVVDILQCILHSDVFYTHPITTVNKNPREPSMEVSIIYGKAACMVRMMEHFLTHETFHKGLRTYLSENAYGVASPDDMFQIMDAQQKLDHILPDDVDVKTVMDSWTLQETFPILYVYRQDGSIDIFQEEFRMKINDKSNYLWWIPISYATSTNTDFNNTQPKVWLKGISHLRLQLNLTDTEWIILNIQATGFYRVSYDAHTWNLIIDYLKSPNYKKIHALNRAQLLDDAFFFVNQYLLNATVAFDLSTYLIEETDIIPWASFFNIISKMDGVLKVTNIYDSFRNYVLFLMRKLYNSVGLVDQEDESHLTKTLRFSVLYWACYFGQNDCVDWASSHYTSWMKDPKNTSMTLDLKTIVYCTALRRGHEMDWEDLWNVFSAHNMATEFLYTVAYFQCTDHYGDMIKKYADTNVSISETELEDIDSCGMAIRDGIRSSGVRPFNKRLNYTASSFIDMTDDVVEERETNLSENTAEDMFDYPNENATFRDIENWLRNFERKHYFS